MKRKISQASILFLLLGMCIGLSSCVKDEEAILVPKTLTEYQQQMNQFVTSEIALVDSCVVGYNQGNYMVASASSFNSYKTAYLTALTAADTTINSNYVTIAQIVATNITLSTPGKNFHGKLFISDRRSLNDSIVAANTLNSATLVGTASGQVPQAAKTAFTTAITTATTIRDASATIERQVLAADTALYVSKQTFMTAIIP